MMKLKVTLQLLGGLVFLKIEDNIYRYTGKKMSQINIKSKNASEQYNRILFLRSFGLLNAYLTVSERSRKQIPEYLHEFDNPCLYAWYYWRYFYFFCFRYHMQTLTQSYSKGNLAS